MQNAINGIAKGSFLHAQRCPFALWKSMFRSMKVYFLRHVTWWQRA
mgnify:CR=1 FL=1